MSRAAVSVSSESNEKRIEEVPIRAQRDELALRAMAFHQLGQADRARKSFYLAR